jgi:hypothetical protein
MPTSTVDSRIQIASGRASILPWLFLRTHTLILVNGAAFLNSIASLHNS